MKKKKGKRQVIIVGGGPAGLVAAIAAARNRADTLLIENGGCLGGVATSGLLSIWGPFNDGGKRIIKGIPEEILNRLIELKGAVDYGSGFIPVNPETLKYVAEKMVIEAGARVLFFTQVVNVVKENHRITAVITASKGGLRKIYGEIFIDATGDGDVAAYAGVPFEKGRAEDGRMQGVTLVFRLGGVKLFGRDYTDFGRNYPEEDRKRCNAIFKKVYKEGKASGLYEVGCIYSIPGMEGVVAINTQHTHNIDGTNPDDLTRATINGRKEVGEIAALFKSHLRGFEDSFILDTAPIVGVRETRRIIGEYILTKQDILNARKFKDTIGKNAYSIDIHLPSIQKESEADIFLKPGTHYDIPYRCLTPKKIENLLVAGRCISTTHEAQASIRIMPCCMVTGQAAGIAAALLIEKKVSPRDLDVSLLQRKLLEQGAMV